MTDGYFPSKKVLTQPMTFSLVVSVSFHHILSQVVTYLGPITQLNCGESQMQADAPNVETLIFRCEAGRNEMVAEAFNYLSISFAHSPPFNQQTTSCLLEQCFAWDHPKHWKGLALPMTIFICSFCILPSHPVSSCIKPRSSHITWQQSKKTPNTRFN